MYISDHTKELNALFDKELNGIELTKSEKKQKKYLLELWEREQAEEEHKQWIANQPV